MPKSVEREEAAMAGKIAALLDSLTFRDVETLAPTERRSFAARFDAFGVRSQLGPPLSLK